MAYAQDVDLVVTMTKEGGSSVAYTCHINDYSKKVTGTQRDVTARCDAAEKTRVVRTKTTLEFTLKIPIGAALFLDTDVGDEYSISVKNDSTASAQSFTNCVLVDMGEASPSGSEQTQSVSFAVNGS